MSLGVCSCVLNGTTNMDTKIQNEAHRFRLGLDTYCHNNTTETERHKNMNNTNNHIFKIIKQLF